MVGQGDALLCAFKSYTGVNLEETNLYFKVKILHLMVSLIECIDMDFHQYGTIESLAIYLAFINVVAVCCCHQNSLNIVEKPLFQDLKLHLYLKFLQFLFCLFQ